MSTRGVSATAPAPEQRRVNGVLSGGGGGSSCALPGMTCSSPTNTPGGGGAGGGGPGLMMDHDNMASSSSSLGGGGGGGAGRDTNGGGVLLKNNNNGRSISGGGMSRLTTGTSSSKMHKAEALARFHPKLITAQIISLQCFQYLAQSILIQINFLLLNIPVSVDRIFTDKYIHIWRREGWADCLMIVFSGMFGAIGLVLIVEKSKKCLDFTFTYFMLHLLLSCIYGGFPSTYDWWITHIVELLIMVLLGEYLCSLKELEMIPLLQL